MSKWKFAGFASIGLIMAFGAVSIILQTCRPLHSQTTTTPVMVVFNTGVDDGISGPAAQYEIRYGDSTSLANNYLTSKIAVLAPATKGLGQVDTLKFTLPLSGGVTHFFAMQGLNSSGDRSLTSNIVGVFLVDRRIPAAPGIVEVKFGS